MTRTYTKRGDQGLTSLSDGRNVSKSDHSIQVLAALEEANAAVGLAYNMVGGAEASMLRRVQNDLLNLSYYVGRNYKIPDPLEHSGVDMLEKWIDLFDQLNKPLRGGVLPGGSAASAQLYMARAVVRRLETVFASAPVPGPGGEKVRAYVNRLSDLLFVMARYFNNMGVQDVVWEG